MVLGRWRGLRDPAGCSWEGPELRREDWEARERSDEFGDRCDGRAAVRAR